MLYSENSQKLLLEKSKSWNTTRNKIHEIFKEILINKYIGDKKEAKEFYNKHRPENILSELNKLDSTKFRFNPKINKIGYNPIFYIRLLYEYLDATCLIIDKFEIIKTTSNNLYYSIFNKYNLDNENIFKPILIEQPDITKEAYKIAPDVLCIRITTNNLNDLKDLPNIYRHFNNNNNNQINTLNDTITFNNQKYILDSIIL